MFTIKNISLILSGKTILSEISATIKPGQSCVISGRNGSGKSSFIKLLLGIEKPTSGEVLLDDRNVARLSQTEHKQYYGSTGIVSQELLPSSHMTTEQILLSSKPSPEQLEDMLWHLEMKGSEKVSTLSSSEKRKLDLGRSMIKNPKLLIWDEPFIFFDSESKERWIHFLKVKKVSGTTMIIATDKPQDFELLEPEIKIQL